MWGEGWISLNRIWDGIVKCAEPEEKSFRLKMQVSAWLLWVGWLCTWTEAAHQCQCQCACPPEEQLAQRSERSEGRGHLRHRLTHQRASHRDRAHRRKGKTKGFLGECSTVKKLSGVKLIIQIVFAFQLKVLQINVCIYAKSINLEKKQNILFFN